jgi:hypothetical protein
VEYPTPVILPSSPSARFISLSDRHVPVRL